MGAPCRNRRFGSNVQEYLPSCDLHQHASTVGRSRDRSGLPAAADESEPEGRKAAHARRFVVGFPKELYPLIAKMMIRVPCRESRALARTDTYTATSVFSVIWLQQDGQLAGRHIRYLVTLGSRPVSASRR